MQAAHVHVRQRKIGTYQIPKARATLNAKRLRRLHNRSGPAHERVHELLSAKKDGVGATGIKNKPRMMREHSC